MREAVALVTEKKSEKSAIGVFRQTVKDFPQVRGRMISRSFQDLIRIIGPVFDKAGEKDEIDALRKRVGLG